MAPFIRETNSTRPTGLAWPGPGLPQDGTDTPPEAHFNIDPVTGGLLVSSVGGGGGPAAHVIVDNFPADYAKEVTLAETNLRIGDEAEVVAPTDTSTSGLNGLVKRSLQHASTIITNLVALLARLPASLGQKTSANSFPVVISSDQSDVPVSIAAPITVSGFANPMPVTDNGASITTDSPQLPAALGQATMAASLPVVLASDQPDVPVSVSNFPATQPVSGPLTDAQLRAAPVPVSDGGGSITTDSPQLPSSLGQQTMAASLPVVIASDQSPVPISATSLPLPALAATAALQTQPGVDIGDATVNNGAGAGAVNIQDGGNSITVDGPLTDSELRASPVPVNGTVTANLGTIAGVATEITLAALNAKVTAVDTGAVTISAALPAGANSIGQVTTNAGTNTSTAALNLEVTQAAMSAKLPATLGQKTMANSLAVVLASDQSPVPTSGTFSDSIPATSDIVGNSLSSTGTLYTVPAGRTFHGSLSLSSSISAAGDSSPSISISGGTPTGTTFQIVNDGLALVAAAVANTLNDVYIHGGGAGAAITFNEGSSGFSAGSIAGRLL